MAFALLLTGCGQESSISNHVEAEKLSCAYGDCKHIIRNVTFPLDNSSLAFKTPLPGLGPIAGGILKFVGDVFAKNTKMGELEMSYTQPIPELPTEVLHSVRLKRFFFYMKPKGNKRRWFHDWFNRYVLGQGHTTFNFLDKFALRLSTADVENPESYVPTLVTEKADKHAIESMLQIFSKHYRGNYIGSEEGEDIVLLKYHKKKKKLDTSDELYGKIHYMETTGDPALIKSFLVKEESFKGYYKRILLLEGALLIELEKDPISDEIFKSIMNDNSEKFSKLGVNFVDTCTELSCLEITVPDVNLVPIAAKGNALQLDALLHADSVPESFNLKGFIEFEVKFDSVI
jgi:hypothetical protein